MYHHHSHPVTSPPHGQPHRSLMNRSSPSVDLPPAVNMTPPDFISDIASPLSNVNGPISCGHCLPLPSQASPALSPPHLATVASIGNSSSVHGSTASADADPLLDQCSIYHGIPFSLFPMDGVNSLLGNGGSHFNDPSPSLTTLVAQAQVLPLMQLISGCKASPPCSLINIKIILSIARTMTTSSPTYKHYCNNAILLVRLIFL
jgi:hypothetical protein